MNRMKKILGATLILPVAFFASCAEELEHMAEMSAIECVEAEIPAFKIDGDTRIVNNYDFQDLKWTSEDRIGLYYHENEMTAAACFSPIRVTSSIADFYNAGFRLAPSSTYYALYPYTEEIDGQMAKVFFTNYVMHAVAQTSDAQKPHLNFKHLSSILKFDIKVPAGLYDYITITSDGQPFIYEGNVNLETGQIEPIRQNETIGGHVIKKSASGTINGYFYNYSWVDKYYTNNYYSEYGTFTFIPTMSHVSAIAWVAPVDLSNSTLTITLSNSISSFTVTAKVKGKKLEAGTIYLLEGEAEQSAPDGNIANAMYTSMYQTLQNTESHNWDMGYTSLSDYIFGDILGGDANKGSTSANYPVLTELELWNTGNFKSNVCLERKWNVSYNSMKLATAFLKATENIPNMGSMRAEAKFIRALHGFEALKVFGAAIPYYTETDYEDTETPQVFNKLLGNYMYCWSKIVKDLEEAANELPETALGNHIHKWAAKGLLAKVYLYWASPYNGKNGANNKTAWSKAYSLLKEIIANGVNAQGEKLALLPNYAKIFGRQGDNTSESVFDIQLYFDSNSRYQTCTINGSHATTPQFIAGGWGLYSPSFQFVNSFIVDDDGLPAGDYMNHPPLSSVSSNGSYAISDLNTYVDPRLDISVGRFMVPYYWDDPWEGWGIPAGTKLATYIQDVSNAGLYFNKKYVPTSIEAGRVSDCPSASEKNLHYMRFAEVLLMAAECAIHSGDLESARIYINAVRERAAITSWWIKNGANYAANYKIGLYTSSFLDSDEAIAALKREIRAELGMEGNRWFDLARWGTIASDLTEYATYESQYIPKFKNLYYQDNWVTLPIPQSVIDASDGYISQGENW